MKTSSALVLCTVTLIIALGIYTRKLCDVIEAKEIHLTVEKVNYDIASHGPLYFTEAK